MLTKEQMLEIILEMKSEIDVNDTSEYNDGWIEGIENLEYAARMSELAVDMGVRSWLEGNSVALSDGDNGYRDAMMEYAERATQVSNIEGWSFA